MVQPPLQQIIEFLRKIGIQVVEKNLPDNTFLPGICPLGSSLLIDPRKVKYPGDLLHEAGHIAVTAAEIRPLLGTDAMDPEWPDDGEELAAILWSYAAISHLNLDPSIVFHEDGYKNGSEWLIKQFANKNYIALPLLTWMGFCDPKDFPKMKRWLR